MVTLLITLQKIWNGPLSFFFFLKCLHLKNFFNWRLITLQYCGGFCLTFTWISHRCTCVPHPQLFCCIGEWDWYLNFSNFSLLIYKKSSDFCVLILYPATLLNSLISSSNFLILSLGILCTVSCHLQTVRALLLPFQYGFLLFLFLLWLLWLGLPKLCWNSTMYFCFCLLDILISDKKVLNSPTIMVGSSISLCISIVFVPYILILCC